MSAIGDYIHLVANNYKKFGINKYGETGSVDATIALAQQRELIQSRINSFSNMSSETITEIENDLNDIFSKNPKKPTSVDIQRAVQQLLSEKYENALGKVDWSTGNIRAKGSSSNTKVKKFKAYGTKSVNISRIIAEIRTLEAYRDELLGSLSKDDLIKADVLSSKIKKIYQQLYKVINQKDKIVASMKLLKTGSAQEVKQQTGGRLNLRRTSGQSLIEAINSAIQELKGPMINLQKGDLFEYTIAAVGEVAGAAANQVFEEAIISSVKGGTRSHKIINCKNFFGDFNPLAYKGSFTVDEETQTIVTHNTSQNKVDVELKWNDIDYQVSAKNVDLSNNFGAGVVSGQSLLYLIQDENANFINHYLNMVAIRDGENISPQPEYLSTLVYSLFTKVLTGKTYGADPANIFIINDNSKIGGIKVYNMKDILDKITTINQGLSGQAVLTFGGRNYFNFSFSNRRQATVKDRLNKIMMDIHKTKVNAAILPSFFK